MMLSAEAPEDLTAATSTFNSLPAHTTELASCTENVQTATVNYPTFKDITNGEYPFLTQLSHSTATPTIPALLKGHIRVVCGYQIPVGSAVPLEDLNAVNEWNSKLAKSRTDVLESKCSASGAHEALMPGTVQPTDAEFGAIDIYAGTIREQLSSSKRPRLAESKTEESKTEEPKTEESKTASELSDARADGSASNAMAD
jgi:hypothetical protein